MKPAVTPRAAQYARIHVCTGCFMKYGINQLGEWQNIKNAISGINVVLTLLLQGERPDEIWHGTGLARQTVYRYISYLCHYRVLPREIKDQYKPVNVPSEIVPYFEKFGSDLLKNGGLAGLRKRCKEQYGWTSAEFDYYWTSPEMQSYRIFGSREHLPRRKMLREQSEKVTSNFIETSEPVTLGQVAQMLGCTESNLQQKGIHKYIARISQEAKRKRDQHIAKTLMRRVDDFIRWKHKLDELVSRQEVFEFLEINPSTLYRKYPDVYGKISRLMKSERGRTKSRKAAQKIERYTERIKHAVHALASVGERPTIARVSAFTGISVSELKRYPQVIQAIHYEQLCDVGYLSHKTI